MIFFLGVETGEEPMRVRKFGLNELRLAELDEKGGWAALGRVDIKLSDLGTLYVSEVRRSGGFGTIEQRVNERSRENLRSLIGN